MGLISELSKTPPEKVATCTFYNWTLTLDADDQEAVQTLLDDRRWSIQSLTETFMENGLSVGSSRVRAHRFGECPPCNKRQTL